MRWQRLKIEAPLDIWNEAVLRNERLRSLRFLIVCGRRRLTGVDHLVDSVRRAVDVHLVFKVVELEEGVRIRVVALHAQVRDRLPHTGSQVSVDVDAHLVFTIKQEVSFNTGSVIGCLFGVAIPSLTVGRALFGVVATSSDDV